MVIYGNHPYIYVFIGYIFGEIRGNSLENDQMSYYWYFVVIYLLFATQDDMTKWNLQPLCYMEHIQIFLYDNNIIIFEEHSGTYFNVPYIKKCSYIYNIYTCPSINQT